MGLRVNRPTTHRLAWSIVLMAFSGCVLPYASPPVRVTQSFGLAAGRLLPDRTTRRERVADTEPITSTRIGLHPLQLMPSLLERRVDLGVGYGFETFTASQLIGRYDKHSLYGELTAFPFVRMIDRGVGTRVGTTVTGDLLFGDAGFGVEVGGGGSLALTLEIFGSTSGAFAAADVDSDDGAVILGGVGGEWAVAMSAYGAYRVLDGASYGQVGVAVSVRLPASAGILMFIPGTSSRSHRRREDSQWERGTVEVNPPSSSGDDYQSGDETPSDGGIGAESGDDDDDGTVEVNPPPPPGTVEVNPP